MTTRIIHIDDSTGNEIQGETVWELTYRLTREGIYAYEHYVSLNTALDKIALVQPVEATLRLAGNY